MTKIEEQRVALVTGASSGFGMLISLALAQAGYIVVAGVRRPEAEDELRLRAEQEGACGLIHPLRLDICRPEHIEQASAYIEDTYGRLDVLVNNAGEAVGGMVEEVPLADWRRQMETNFFGTLAVTQAMLPLLRTTGRAKIIMLSSISGVVGFPGYGPYAASKFAVEGFSESLSMELAPWGVDVVLVQPGAYGTPIWRKSFGAIQSGEHSPYREVLTGVLAYSKRTAEQAGDPMEVARLVARIATMRKPKFRYRLPRSTQWSAWMKLLLPDRLFQRIVMRLLRQKDAGRE